MTYANLKAMLAQADSIDRAEGLLAYERYARVLSLLAVKYGFEFDRVVAGFAALSPNNDYWGNLRSLVSVLHGVREGIPCKHITVSTYGHCRDRAYDYVTGAKNYVTTVKGPKIRAFYFNILDPLDRRYVTIDGHMAAAYRGNGGTMKENIVPRWEYNDISRCVKRLAAVNGMIPNQVQAIIWFTRKRVLKIKYDPQLDLFRASDDKWGTLVDIERITPYDSQ